MFTFKARHGGTISAQAYRTASPLGSITILVSTQQKLLGLWFEDLLPKGFVRYQAAIAADTMTSGCPEPILTWLEQYFAGQKPGPEPALEFIGTEFERKVWHALLHIPYGQTTTYGAIAQRLFPERSTLMARAVGQAVGANPICLIVPCHRVLGADGKLTGYAQGLERKQKLLELEGILLPVSD